MLTAELLYHWRPSLLLNLLCALPVAFPFFQSHFVLFGDLSHLAGVDDADYDFVEQLGMW